MSWTHGKAVAGEGPAGYARVPLGCSGAAQAVGKSARTAGKHRNKNIGQRRQRVGDRQQIPHRPATRRGQRHGGLRWCRFRPRRTNPAHHQRTRADKRIRDPFNRMLAAQATLEGLPLVSCDQLLETFGVELVW